MIPIKKFIAEIFLGNTYHFKCDCIIPIDVVGTVKDYDISSNEIVLLVDIGTKIIHIGLNTTSLVISPV